MCKNPDCINESSAFDGLCNYCHRFWDGKKAPEKKVYKIAKESKKRKDENKEYSKERKEYLKVNNKCMAGLDGCKKVATQIHHRKGRVGKLLTDTKYWLPVCEDCHRKIEDNPQMAYEKGLSVKRNAA